MSIPDGKRGGEGGSTYSSSSVVFLAIGLGVFICLERRGQGRCVRRLRAVVVLGRGRI